VLADSKKNRIMKTFKFRQSIQVIIAAIILSSPFGCKKSNNQQTSVPRKKYAWAVGSQDSTKYALILFSPDGGDTWQRKGAGSPSLYGVDLYSVWAVDSSTVWAVGSGNCILRTNDGGTTWTRFTVGQAKAVPNLQSVSVAGTENVWISGSGGRVYNSNDGGVTWTVFDTSFFQNGNMQGIFAITPQVVYVAGGIYGSASHVRGFIARTTDGGQSWDSITPADNYNRHEWIGVKASDINHIVVYGGTSHYVFSNNAGITWNNDSVPASGGGGTGGADINCLAMLDSRTWWGAFDYDAIFITADGGASWTKQASAGPPGMWLFGIDYYDRNLCIIVGQGSESKTGKIINTSNGGALWNLRYFADAWINKVSFIKN
jgi:photosystem II stability/assembly factor-like uncharacterized protein